MTMHEMITQYTERGECKCGQCIDVGNKPDPTSPHTVDMVFFKVAPQNNPTKAIFLEVTQAHKGDWTSCNVLDGAEHNFMELGAWIGDQGMAMQYMALGVQMGVFNLLTPRTILGAELAEDVAVAMACSGLITIKAKPEFVTVGAVA